MLYSQPSTWKRCGRSQPSMVSQSWSPTLPRNMYLVMMIVMIEMMIVMNLSASSAILSTWVSSAHSALNT